MSRPRRSTQLAYAVLSLALLIAAALLLVRPEWAVLDVLLPVLLGCVAAAAWLGGYGPALGTTTLGVLVGMLFAPGRPGMALLGLFVVAGVLVTAAVGNRALVAHMRRNEERYRRLASASAQLVWRMAPDGSQAQPLLGDDPSGRSAEQPYADGRWLEVVHPDERARTAAGWERALKTGEPYEVRHRARTRERAYRTFLTRVVPLKNKAGRIVEWIGTRTDITEQAQAEEILREQADLLALAHDAIIVRDLDGTIRYWGSGAEEVYGYTLAEALGESTHALFRTQFPAPLAEIDERFLRDGRWEGELAQTRKDGQVILVDSRWALRPGPAGRASVLEFNRDVTDRRRGERALGEREQRLRAAYEHAPVGIAEVWPDGRFAAVNLRFSELTGYSRDELLVRGIRDITHPDDIETDLGQFARVLAGEITFYTLEKRYLRKNGGVVWVELVVSALRDAQGRPWRGIGIATDITERKRAEEKLRTRQQQLRVTLSSIGDAVVVTDAAGRIAFLNPAAERLTGWPRREATRRPLEDVFPLVDQTTRWPAEVPVRRALSGGSGVGLAGRAVLLTRDGREVPVEDNAAPITGPSGRVGGAVLVFRDVTERRQAQEALRDRERFIQRVLDTTPEIVYVFDLVEGRLTFINDQVKRALGIMPEEVRARGAAPLADLLHPDDLARLAAPPTRFQNARDGEILEVDYRLRHADGTWHWFASREIVFTRSPDGTPRQVLGVATDVTDRRRAEEALRQEEARYRQLVELLPAGVYAVAADGTITFYNQRAVELWGRSPTAADRFTGAERVFLPDGTLSPPERTPMAETMRSGRALRGAEVVGERPDGSRIVAEVNIDPVRDADGRVVGAINVFHDVTDRKRAERRMNFLAEFGATLAAAAPDYEATLRAVARVLVPTLADYCLVFLASEDGEVRQVAEAHVDPEKDGLLRDLARTYVPSTNPTSRVCAVIRSGEPDLVPEAHAGVLEAGVSAEWRERIHAELAPGSWVTVPLSARGRNLGCLQLVCAGSGRRYGADDLAFATELARRAALAVDNARLYAEVREADRRKDEFLAVLAHELRNPLAPVKNALRILRLAGSDPAAAGESLDIMERQVGHLVRLVDDLLDVARITKGKIVLNRQPVELAAVVQSAVETSRPLLEEKGHTLTVDGPGGPVWLEADLTRLAQVVANLLNNSARYTPPGGRIGLVWGVEERPPGAEDDRHAAVIRVRDNGVGIPPEQVPRIFDMFAQADRPLERSAGGLGIGLTLVRRLVEMHAGTVEALSAGVGHGAEFIVRLPVLRQDSSGPSPDKGTSALVAPSAFTPQRSPLRVLVVDDNRDAANSLGTLLRLSGCEVRVVHDGPAAVELARSFHPRVLFVDLGMPGMDGFAVARAVRREPGLGEPMLVALTGWGQPDDRRRSAEAGFDHHLTKPADPQVLEGLLAGLTNATAGPEVVR